MFHWRITKYKPQFRNASGAFQKNEWSSFSDVGNIYEGKEFLFDDYLPIENAYINAISLFINCMQIPSLEIVSLEKHTISKNDNYLQKNMIETFTRIKNHENINKKTISIVARLALREYIWCKLEAPEMYVHFGYDYYMYIGSSKECNEAKSKIIKSGLFIEPYKSPHI